MDWVSSEKGQHEPGVVRKHKIDVLNLLFQESGKHVIHFRIELLQKMVGSRPFGAQCGRPSVISELLLSGETLPEGPPSWRFPCSKTQVGEDLFPQPGQGVSLQDPILPDIGSFSLYILLTPVEEPLTKAFMGSDSKARIVLFKSGPDMV